MKGKWRGGEERRRRGAEGREEEKSVVEFTKILKMDRE